MSIKKVEDQIQLHLYGMVWSYLFYDNILEVLYSVSCLHIFSFSNGFSSVILIFILVIEIPLPIPVTQGSLKSN